LTLLGVQYVLVQVTNKYAYAYCYACTQGNQCHQPVTILDTKLPEHPQQVEIDCLSEFEQDLAKEKHQYTCPDNTNLFNFNG